MTRALKIQTEPFKVCRSHKLYPPKEHEAESQTTEEFRQPIPVYFTPASSGIDSSSQIAPGELFDFDLAVEPILEVLVGRTLELGVLEVIEEIQLEKLRVRRTAFEAKRQAEQAEVFRLEAEALSREEEKVRRLRQEECMLKLSNIACKKIACADFALCMFNIESVITKLSRDGFFKDPSLIHLESVTVPSLIQEAIDNVYETKEILSSGFC